MQFVFDNERPIYKQLVDQFKIQMLTGMYSPDDKLPSVREIALKTGVNPNTVQRAFSELEQVGLVYTKRTSGRYITEDQNKLKNMRDEMASEWTKEFVGKMRQLSYDEKEICEFIQKLGKEK